MESHPWPYTQDSRPSPSGSANNGGDYIATRRGMLSRYACRWLRALHDQSPPQYAILLFDLAREIAETEKMPIGSLSVRRKPCCGSFNKVLTLAFDLDRESSYI